MSRGWSARQVPGFIHPEQCGAGTRGWLRAHPSPWDYDPHLQPMGCREHGVRSRSDVGAPWPPQASGAYSSSPGLGVTCCGVAALPAVGLRFPLTEVSERLGSRSCMPGAHWPPRRVGQCPGFCSVPTVYPPAPLQLGAHFFCSGTNGALRHHGNVLALCADISCLGQK